MPLIEPTIDDRNFEAILNEALARIPVHNPEWTNFNDSDPGVTILQLFAFMTESLLYRANRVPERNRIKFLRLLQIPIQAAAAAQGIVTFSNPKGPLSVRLLQPDVEVSAGPVPFRTQDGLDVLPIEAQVFYKAKPDLSADEEAQTRTLYEQIYKSLGRANVKFAYYETRSMEAPVSGAALPSVSMKDTVDGRLWVALLARPGDDVDKARAAIAGKVLTLAVVPAVEDAERVLPPGGQRREDSQATLVFERPNVASSDADTGARYVPLKSRPSTNLLQRPGVVEITLPASSELTSWETSLEPLDAGTAEFPPSIEEDEVLDRLITWVRIQPGGNAAAGKIAAAFSYVGINASRVTQRSRVFAEFLGQGTGEPDQTLALVNTPVLPESVSLTVNGETWSQTDDLAAAPSEVPRRSRRTSPGIQSADYSASESKVYTVERESGVVRFGSGLRGARPPAGAVIMASYDYGGGLQGMVGVGAVNKGASLPAGVKVSNPVPTWGGDEAETVSEAERRIPHYLRHRDRLVTEEDFEDITYRTPGVDIGRVEVRPLFHPDREDFAADGVVTVMVIPKYDAAQPDAPKPDRLFLETVCNHLDPRRLITTELHVRGPRYVPIYVSAGIDVVPGTDIAPVREAVKEQIRTFLSPLVGGFDEDGWPLERDVDSLEVLAVAARVHGVSKVNELLLAEGTEAEKDTVSVTGLRLPRLMAVAVEVGDAPSIDALRGEEVGEEAEETIVPIPIIPPEC